MTEPTDNDAVTPAAEEVPEQPPVSDPDAVPETRRHADFGSTNNFTENDDES